MNHVLLLSGPVLGAGDTGEVNLGLLAQYGVLGIVCAVLIVYAKGQTARESARADRGEAEVKRLNALIAEQMVPELVKVSETLKRNIELAGETQRVLVAVQQIIERAESGTRSGPHRGGR